MGWGDPASPIAVRVWSHVGAPRDLLTLARERLSSAFDLRRRLFPDDATTAYRLCNGEGDRAPGVVVDRYGDVAVVRPDGAAAAALVEKLTPWLVERLAQEGVEGLSLRLPSRGGAPAVRAVLAGRVPDVVQVREHGLDFEVDLARGQKTGAFLDQRENRRRVGELTGRLCAALDRAPRVLNLFSYAGGFSLAAAKAGGVVTSVDVAAAAHATAQRSFRLSGLETRPHSFVSADVFAFLADAKAKGEAYDLVVSDPPSFAPSERTKPRALSAYRSLHQACAEVLAPGGTLCAASCSSHVSMEDFLGTLDDSALGGRELRVTASYGPPPDHPTLAAFPEGRYLKLVVMA